MTRWHPILSGADPADAWFDPHRLAQLRAAEEADERYRHLIRRRDRFEAALARLSDPTEQDRQALWDAADNEETDNATD